MCVCVQVETNEVFKLLEQHGLQHFADTLLRNGYDKVAFLGEVSNEELETIGIEQDSDREKVREGRGGGRVYSR